MKKNILFSFCTLLWLFVGTSFAAEVTLFGPNQYSRTSGAPNVYTDTFSAAAGEGMLIIKNESRNGKNRMVNAIRSASIFVNGQQVFGRRHFKKWVHHSEKRDHDSEKRDHDFEKRDHDSERRDHDSEKRDHDSEKRDHHSKKRVHLLEIPVYLLEGDNKISVKLARRHRSYLFLEVKGEEVKTDLPTTTGTLTGDETWSGEVAITGDVVVPQGVTLTINPNTVVSFMALNDEQTGGSSDSLCELIIEGSLVADQVTFTSSNTSNPTAGDWYGIVVQPSSGLASVNLSGCIVEYANSGIKAVATGQDVSLTVTDSEVRHSFGDGFHIDANSGSVITLDIDSTQISDNGGMGIYCYVKDNYSQLNGGITNSTIADNNGYGIYTTIRFGGESRFIINNNTVYNSGTGIYCSAFDGRMTVDITGNEVYNGTDGIYCYAFWNSTFSALIADNSIHDNSGRGIYCNAWYQGYGFLAPEIRYNQIYNNAGDGIYCDRQRVDDKLDPAITHNNVHGNGGVGIYCKASEPVDVLYNDIHENTGNGLYLNAGDGSNVNHNNLYDNSGSYDLENGNSYKIDGQYNFWGTSTTGEMVSGVPNITRIYDNYDDSAIGTVDYSNWQ